jgi:hypothetical protein
MDRPKLVAKLLVLQGGLLVVVAAIHLSSVPQLHQFLATEVSAANMPAVWPPFVLSFVVMGILLIPLGLGTIYCARGILQRARWAWAIAMINALTVLSLPVALFLIMGRVYFHAVPFLVASILITAVGLSMAWPLLWVRREIVR